MYNIYYKGEKIGYINDKSQIDTSALKEMGCTVEHIKQEYVEYINRIDTKFGKVYMAIGNIAKLEHYINKLVLDEGDEVEYAYLLPDSIENFEILRKDIIVA
ncbi:hypothetical protein D307_gp036 [Bacillus phage Bastille]|uniref:Uncharacterized protein n=5 Tax=Bastillevirus TaxID=1918010 RepID=A0A024B0R0_9CAUD|nr:hypothetical protein D307_gp036 [Bacillus phage Bastille]YP_009035538.1 hypothetical protein FP76_gp017 [Bacillus phage Evoli]YP_009036918.1 hypothetical protein FP74_gp015 [Bacillus phage CAM003]AMW61769.1 hypothetical protein DNAM5_18 [Bacillus phage Vinny]ASU00864.1 hypothetical protein ANTHONY_17 [Bacillus phage Anthony]AZF89127.1 hypothetical protein Goe5_c00190 [Bacillus phage vB_BthM-Goe5]AEQ34428.1 hypothetical protein [Bacillus phage Bastille]AHZ09452.1 hypothetical protein [Baci